MEIKESRQPKNITTRLAVNLLLPQVIFTIIGIDYEGGKEIFSFPKLVNMLRILQIEIFIISAVFVFFHKVIEKEKKMRQDAVYLNEKMRLYSTKKTTKTDDKFHLCSKLCKFIYSMFARLHWRRSSHPL